MKDSPKKEPLLEEPRGSSLNVEERSPGEVLEAFTEDLIKRERKQEHEDLEEPCLDEMRCGSFEPEVHAMWKLRARDRRQE